MIEALLSTPPWRSAGNPPELKTAVLRGGAFELRNDIRHDCQAAIGVLGSDPTQQGALILRPIPSRHLLRRFSRWRDTLPARRQDTPIRREVEQHQGILGQERLPSRCPQVVEQRQQYHRNIGATAEHPVHVGRQLDDRAGQRIEAFRATAQIGWILHQIPRDMLHLFSEQGATFDLAELQGAVRLVQSIGATGERRAVFGSLDEVL